VILLDTHIWVWWADNSDHLSNTNRKLIGDSLGEGLGVSVISCWEVCKLFEKGRLRLAMDLSDWIAAALALPSVILLPITPQIAVESVKLPPPFHADPADQLIVATPRVMRARLLTADQQLLNYSGVSTIK
jgi:PIN domain nuclease of toxin-antitoxin system